MLSFHLVCGLFCCARALKFDSFSFTYFCFYFHYSRTWVIEDLFVIYFKKCSACVFLEDFCNSDLTFRFSIHFEFIFVCGARQCSNCIFCNTCSCQVSLAWLFFRYSFYWLVCGSAGSPLLQGFSLWLGWGGCSLAAVCGLVTAVLLWLWCTGISSCSSWALERRLGCGT